MEKEKITWMRTSKVPLFDNKGEVTGVLGIFENITEQKHQILELEEAKQRLHQTENELEHILQMLQEKGMELEGINTKKKS